MLRIVLIRPGSTEFDEQGRIKGTLDIPLSLNGSQQASRLAGELQEARIEVVYTAPCQSAVQTAEMVAAQWRIRSKRLDMLRNLDHGLWHGKLIEEVRQKQPKVYRLWQESPEAVCPPEGETLASARLRVQKAMRQVLRKHRRGVIAVIAPEPMASIVRSYLANSALRDLWKAECDFGGWEVIDLDSSREALDSPQQVSASPGQEDDHGA